jgi:phosphoribosylformylglycinamidine (FGAM) synthase PurS component
MPQRIEITLKEQLLDAEGQSLRLKAKNYFDIDLHRVRTIHVVTIDADLTADQVERVRAEIFTNPVTQVSSLQPLDVDFDWIIWVGFRPGVRDNPGATAVEAMEDLLRLQLKPGQAVYTSKRYCLKGSGVTRRDAEKIAGELLANDIIQQWAVFDPDSGIRPPGIGIIIPKVILDHQPTVATIPSTAMRPWQRLSDRTQPGP